MTRFSDSEGYLVLHNPENPNPILKDLFLDKSKLNGGYLYFFTENSNVQETIDYVNISDIRFKSNSDNLGIAEFSIGGNKTLLGKIHINEDKVDPNGRGELSFTWQSSIDDNSWVDGSSGTQAIPNEIKLTIDKSYENKYIRCKLEYIDGENFNELVYTQSIFIDKIPLNEEVTDQQNIIENNVGLKLWEFADTDSDSDWISTINPSIDSGTRFIALKNTSDTQIDISEYTLFTIKNKTDSDNILNKLEFSTIPTNSKTLQSGEFLVIVRPTDIGADTFKTIFPSNSVKGHIYEWADLGGRTDEENDFNGYHAILLVNKYTQNTDNYYRIISAYPKKFTEFSNILHYKFYKLKATDDNLKKLTITDVNYNDSLVRYIEQPTFDYQKITTNIDVSFLKNTGAATFIITGDIKVGSTLTVQKQTDDPDGTNTSTKFNYKWEISDNGIDSWATSIWYPPTTTQTLSGLDEGKYLRCSVTYTDLRGFSNTAITKYIAS